MNDQTVTLGFSAIFIVGGMICLVPLFIDEIDEQDKKFGFNVAAVSFLFGTIFFLLSLTF